MAGVDDLAVRGPVGDVVLQQEHDRVLQVFEVYLHDLHLLEQQVGDAYGRAIEVEPALQRDPMAEEELVHEDVDVELAVGPGEAIARALGDHVDRPVLVVAEFGEELADGRPLRLVGREVDVGQGARHLLEEPDVPRAVDPVGDGPENAQGDSGALGGIHDPERLDAEFLVLYRHGSA